MAIKVETYEEVERNAETLQPENAAECAVLAEKLGLKGQVSLTTTNPIGEKSVVPYKEMTKEENFVYSTLLAQHEQVENYTRGPIPLRVLQVLEHAKSLEFYSSFEVWHDRVGPNPILIAKKSYSLTHILARWGEVLEPFSILQEKALAKYKAYVQVELLKIQQEVTNDLNILKGLSNCNEGELSNPTYYGITRG